MDVKKAYSIWANQYDSNENKTRDIEAIALRETLANTKFDKCLEIGCGTGKNTEWLVGRGNEIVAVDLSDEMLGKAKDKIASPKVNFIQADITKEWGFAHQQFDLVTFSLVLEHIEDLDDIFRKVSKVIAQNGLVYIGELHPFKQYTGTKARFETEDGLHIVTCYKHNISDFTDAAKLHGFQIEEVKEYFDDNNKDTIPRILTILFRKV